MATVDLAMSHRRHDEGVEEQGLTKLYLSPAQEEGRYRKEIDPASWGDYVKSKNKKILAHGLSGS